VRTLPFAILALCSFALISTRAGNEKRLWTSSDGKSTFEGELMESSPVEVVIKRSADLLTFKIPLNTLSETDQAYVKGRLHPQERGPGHTPDGSLILEDAPEDFRKNDGLINFTPEEAGSGMDFVKGVFRQIENDAIRITLTMSKPIAIEEMEYLLRVSVNFDDDESTGFDGWTPGEDCRAFFTGKKWTSVVTSDFKSTPGKDQPTVSNPSNTFRIEKPRMTRNYFEFVMRFEEAFPGGGIGIDLMTMKEGDESKGIPYVCLDSLTEEPQIKLPVSK